MSVLLDTHVLLWWLQDEKLLSPAQRRLIREADSSNPLLVADVSLWEVATLHELGRIRLGLPVREWLERAVAPPLVELCGISPAIAAQVASLPSTFPRDPADRLITATALVRGATLLTRDRGIIESEVVPTVA